jgi:DNA-binding MarR family transcriptional regulator
MHKEFIILDLIEKNPFITQRELGKHTFLAVSMVNQYLEKYEKNGLLRRKYYSTKKVEYLITKKGLERRKLLNIRYLKSTNDIYRSAKDNILVFLKQISLKGFNKILLYGAGEVAEILQQSVMTDDDIGIEVIAIIDDDFEKQNSFLGDIPIIDLGSIIEVEHDGILISSYSDSDNIYKKLCDINYDKNKILQFFD